MPGRRAHRRWGPRACLALARPLGARAPETAGTGFVTGSLASYHWVPVPAVLLLGPSDQFARAPSGRSRPGSPAGCRRPRIRPGRLEKLIQVRGGCSAIADARRHTRSAARWRSRAKQIARARRRGLLRNSRRRLHHKAGARRGAAGRRGSRQSALSRRGIRGAARTADRGPPRGQLGPRPRGHHVPSTPDDAESDSGRRSRRATRRRGERQAQRCTRTSKRHDASTAEHITVAAPRRPTYTRQHEDKPHTDRREGHEDPVEGAAEPPYA